MLDTFETNLRHQMEKTTRRRALVVKRNKQKSKLAIGNFKPRERTPRYARQRFSVRDY